MKAVFPVSSSAEKLNARGVNGAIPLFYLRLSDNKPLSASINADSICNYFPPNLLPQ